MTKKLWVGSTLLSAALLLGACSNDEATNNNEDAESIEDVAEVEQTSTGENTPTEAEQILNGDTEVEDGLMMAPEEFENNFNNFIDANVPGALPHLTAGEKSNGEVQDSIIYRSSSDVGIVASIKKETGLINSLMFTGVPDGTEDSSLRIIVGMGTFIGAVDPSLTPEDRNDVLKGLGMFDDDFNVLDHEGQTTKNGVKYALNVSEVVGIMLSAEK